MTTKPGTEWTEPGTGATLGGLWDRAVWENSLRARRRIKRLSREAVARGAQVDRTGRPELAAVRTNLRLTGEPLTAEDVARIARAA